MTRKHLWSRGAAVSLAALMATAAWAQPKAYCPAGTQAKWAGGVLRCEKLTIVASAPPISCESRFHSACAIGTRNTNGELAIVSGGRDHCNFYCSEPSRGPGAMVLIERYPICPTGLSMTQDAGPNGQDLCIATSPSWVQPLLAAN